MFKTVYGKFCAFVDSSFDVKEKVVSVTSFQTIVFSPRYSLNSELVGINCALAVSLFNRHESKTRMKIAVLQLDV